MKELKGQRALVTGGTSGIGAEADLVEISGFGPTDTQYVNSADAPKTPNR